MKTTEHSQSLYFYSSHTHLYKLALLPGSHTGDSGQSGSAAPSRMVRSVLRWAVRGQQGIPYRALQTRTRRPSAHFGSQANPDTGPRLSGAIGVPLPHPAAREPRHDGHGQGPGLTGRRPCRQRRGKRQPGRRLSSQKQRSIEARIGPGIPSAWAPFRGARLQLRLTRTGRSSWPRRRWSRGYARRDGPRRASHRGPERLPGRHARYPPPRPGPRRAGRSSAARTACWRRRSWHGLARLGSLGGM